MMLKETDFIYPDWPAPANVKALQTTRAGGLSRAPYDSLNLGTHVADVAHIVAANRLRLSPFLPAEPVWLNQVHGVHVIDASNANGLPEADAAYSKKSGIVCTVMTADCLPVLLCDEAGTVVAAAHAGWRGLCQGVLGATVIAMHTPPEKLMAWLGPAIGAHVFEVGNEVRSAFIAQDEQAAQAFTAAPNNKWLMNIYQLARQRLKVAGIAHVYGGNFCTYTDKSRFFSYRRDGLTGRMASMIWLNSK
ncbi:MAG: peptidoglycan editing factor PgeF [Methylophilaceae bacterium]|nr:peptidoglycan editing factor PgeF [Methylophilaceae bacterium]